MATSWRNMTPSKVEAWLRDRPSRQPRAQASPSAPPRAESSPQRPTSPPHPALERLFQRIQALAMAQGWAGQYTYNGEGVDAGLHVILVREVILFAEVVVSPRDLTASQHVWTEALRATGQVEAYTWTPTLLPQITERLSRPREAG